MSLLLVVSLACRWLVAAVVAAGDGQNILPMYNVRTKKLTQFARTTQNAISIALTPDW
jgi:hypothetical protein